MHLRLCKDGHGAWEYGTVLVAHVEFICDCVFVRDARVVHVNKPNRGKLGGAKAYRGALAGKKHGGTENAKSEGNGETGKERNRKCTNKVPKRICFAGTGETNTEANVTGIIHRSWKGAEKKPWNETIKNKCPQHSKRKSRTDEDKTR